MPQSPPLIIQELVDRFNRNVEAYRTQGYNETQVRREFLDPFLLGILNSRLFWFVISHISIPFGVRAGEFRYRLIYQYMEKVPIKELQVGNELDQAKGRHLRELVEQMLVLNDKHSLARAPHDQIRLQRQIDATDLEIVNCMNSPTKRSPSLKARRLPL